MSDLITVLKRPGRKLQTNNDIRFLLIIFEVSLIKIFFMFYIICIILIQTIFYY